MGLGLPRQILRPLLFFYSLLLMAGLRRLFRNIRQSLLHDFKRTLCPQTCHRWLSSEIPTLALMRSRARFMAGEYGAAKNCGEKPAHLSSIPSFVWRKNQMHAIAF
jgi:hypothetical protein